MDTLTHGLFGLAIGALRRREPAKSPLTPTEKAVLLACVLAAEIPDLDYLLPAGDPVLVTLRAHRGLSHSLMMAPAVAAIATLVARLVFRSARTSAVVLQALVAVVFAHLLPDLWTGWGTRILLPWSAERMTLDWTVVVDPLVTLPLLVGAVLAFRARAVDYRRPLWIGLGVTVAYLGARISIRASLQSTVESAYGTADVNVFPAPLRVLQWRYVAETGAEYAVGTISLGGDPVEEGRHPRGVEAANDLRGPTVVDEVLAWARYPTVTVLAREDGGKTLTVADLRYHAGGEPTLKFIVELAGDGSVESARLDRGSARDLVDRFRR
ncbi:MAG: metal-dependent hydrolase [Polyangiaceae bacterium]|nr:metal-dependent hydrolase [Polyangiaceae bacterium]